MRYNFELTGVTALLLHNNNVEARDEIDARRKQMKNSKAGDDRTPPDSWKGYLYLSDDGDVCMPSENLLACLLHAGAKLRLTGKETLKQHTQRIAFDRMDYPIVIADGAVMDETAISGITGEFRQHCDAARRLGFRLHVKPCRVGTASHVRVRPMFPTWSVSGAFEIDAEDEPIFPLASLQRLFDIAGRLTGLGDWRPASPKRPGQFGRFTARVVRA